MTAPDLKPCPFCGDRAELRGEEYSPDYVAGVSCKCGAGILGQYQHEAIAAWNTRAPLSEALAVPTYADREWIDARADELFRENERRRGAIRPQTITPQDFRDYFVVNATLERFAALRAIGERAE